MVSAMKGSAPPQHQVFISFRGSDVRHNFFSFLKDALIKNDINVVTDEDAPRGKPIDENLLKLIRGSRIAIVIFSKNYPESTWCLDELVEIKKQMDLKMLDSCPIFFEVKTCHVKAQDQASRSDFDYTLLRLEHEERKKARQISKKAWENAEERFDEWRRSLISIASCLGLTYKKDSNQATFVNEIVEKVKTMLDNVSSLDVVPQHQVHISFRGLEMPNKFSNFLRAGLQKSGIIVSTEDEDISRIESRNEVERFFTKIRDSKVVLLIFSENHKSSAWFLEEVYELGKHIELKMLQVLPIFYVVDPNDTTPNDVLMEFVGSIDNGTNEFDEEYKDNLVYLTKFISTNHKSDADFVEYILKKTKKMLETI